MSGRLIESLATTPALADAVFRRVGSAGHVGIRSRVGARRSAKWSDPSRGGGSDHALPQARRISIFRLPRAMPHFAAGTPAIPLVKMLTDQVRKADAEAARFVHWGATSQDVADTAMSLLLKRAEPILIADLLRLEKALADLSERHKRQRHAGTNAASAGSAGDFRTESRRMAGIGSPRQAAFTESIPRLRPCCSLAERAGRWHRSATAELPWLKRLSADLGFGNPPAAPWHTQRDQLATLICALWSADRISRQDGARHQSAHAERGGRGGRARRRRPRRILDHAEQA